MNIRNLAGRTVARVVVALVFMMACSFAVFGQQTTGSIVGTVTDPQGAVVNIEPRARSLWFPAILLRGLAVHWQWLPNAQAELTKNGSSTRSASRLFINASAFLAKGQPRIATRQSGAFPHIARHLFSGVDRRYPVCRNGSLALGTRGEDFSPVEPVEPRELMKLALATVMDDPETAQSHSATRRPVRRPNRGTRIDVVPRPQPARGPPGLRSA